MERVLERKRGELKEAGGLRKGFTLIELLIVIAIIAILAAIAIPQYKKYKQRAYVTAMTSDAHQIIQAEEAYNSQKDKYLVLTDNVNDGNFDVGTYDTTKNALEDPDGKVIVQFSKDVKLTDLESETCADGSPGYKFTLAHNKTDKTVTFDSCTDSTPQEQ
jgi:type IV pilus assembly protein PilA